MGWRPDEAHFHWATLGGQQKEEEKGAQSKWSPLEEQKQKQVHTMH